MDSNELLQAVAERANNSFEQLLALVFDKLSAEHEAEVDDDAVILADELLVQKYKTALSKYIIAKLVVHRNKNRDSYDRPDIHEALYEAETLKDSLKRELREQLTSRYEHMMSSSEAMIAAAQTIHRINITSNRTLLKFIRPV